jgi:hypothetical protein
MEVMTVNRKSRSARWRANRRLIVYVGIPLLIIWAASNWRLFHGH